MAEVWSARDLETGESVAVKIAQNWVAGDPHLRARFEREGRILAQLQSPFVCGFRGSGHLEDGIPYLVLEKFTGETLRARLEREGILPFEEVAPLVDQILQSLQVAHARRIVHRDLSPANVFLHRLTESREIVKVLDFGVAKVIDPTSSISSTGKQATVGSIPYIAPEQLGNSADAGPRADLYAVGAILFRALAGAAPFGSARPVAIAVLKREHEAPTIDEATGTRWPEGISKFLAKMLARDPGQRFASADRARRELRHAMTAGSSSA